MGINKMQPEFNNQKYQEIIDVQNAVIFQLDLEGNYTSLNFEWVSLTDYLVEDTLGTHFLNYVNTKDQIVISNHFKILIEGQKDGIFQEIELVSKQGNIEDVHLFLRADKDQSQNIISFSGTLTCLSSRRPNVVAYKENESNYRLISENMTDMVAVLAEDGLVLYASPSHTTILGRDLDEYIGSYPITHIHPEDWERIFHFFHEMISNWRPAEIDYRCMHNNGDWLYLEMKCTPIKGPDGKIQVISVSRDITLRKKAEEELRQASNKFKTLISSLPYGVLVEDEKGNPTLYNEAYLNIFNFSAQPNQLEAERKQQLFSEANHIIKNFNTYIWQKKQISKSLRSRRAEEIHLNDGRTVERDAIPLLEDGKFDGYLWIFRDVTEEKVAELKLQEANLLLQKLSMADGLTGIANRRCFDEALIKAWDSLTSHSGSISLLLFDLDFFKAFNDLYGHQAGDDCLQQIGRILKGLSWGKDDLPARYGGEEFVVLLPGKSVEQAIEIANKIQEAVESSHIHHKGSLISEFLTLSIGISSTNRTVKDQPSDLIKEADIALYEAKKSGRNQIKVYGRSNRYRT
jgi:diguanylate cyclase (GGDEF)-like protein/PAS domain S-box-containing protein